MLWRRTDSGRWSDLAGLLTCGALAITVVACVAPPAMVYAADSRELIHAKNKASISELVKAEPGNCEPASTGDELCTWTYRPYSISDMTYILRCRLPVDGASREPRSCVFTLPGPDGQMIRGPEHY